MRRATHILAAVLALCGVACLAATNVTEMTLMDRDGAGLTAVRLDRGKLIVAWKPRVPYRPAWAGQTNRYGLRYNVYSDGSGYAWAPLGLGGIACSAPMFVALFVGWRPRRPAARGLCPSCGYDLRATPECCPECGAAAPARPAAAPAPAPAPAPVPANGG